MHYIGIDPGVSGGVAILSESGLVIDTTKMPETVKDLLDWLRERIGWFASSARQSRAVLEKVNPGVFGAGKFGQRMGVVSAFTFGRGVGRLEATLAALEIPYDEVPPGTWQKALQCQTRGDKNVSKRRAQQLFPSVKVTHAIADALLIAEYCRRSHRATLQPPAPCEPFQGRTGPDPFRDELPTNDSRPARSKTVTGSNRKNRGGTSGQETTGIDARADAGRLGETSPAMAGGRVGASRADTGTLARATQTTAIGRTNGEEDQQRSEGGEEGRGEEGRRYVISETDPATGERRTLGITKGTPLPAAPRDGAGKGRPAR